MYGKNFQDLKKWVGALKCLNVNLPCHLPPILHKFCQRLKKINEFRINLSIVSNKFRFYIWGMFGAGGKEKNVTEKNNYFSFSRISV
jgi:hypothetical protein